jgi:SAM-dependent methyltransferase
MEQRFAFDQIASLYKAARPDYPEALIKDVVSYADLKPNDKILEVGCGSGQATKSFPKRNFPIVAIDPGPDMLRGARESLADFGNVEFLEATFETWPAKREEFRLIIAAQSWHWVSPEVRFAKAAEVHSQYSGTFPWDYLPPYSLYSRTFICVTPVTGVARRRLGTYPMVHSEDGLMSPGCSSPSRTEPIRGDGDRRHRTILISCERNRSTGC